MRNPLRTRFLAHAMALGATIFVASADEIHQTFLPNRTGTFSDVVLDTSGGLAYQALLCLIVLAFTYRSQLADAGMRRVQQTMQENTHQDPPQTHPTPASLRARKTLAKPVSSRLAA